MSFQPVALRLPRNSAMGTEAPPSVNKTKLNTTGSQIAVVILKAHLDKTGKVFWCLEHVIKKSNSHFYGPLIHFIYFKRSK